MPDISQASLISMAEEKLADARLLLHHGRWANAYYLAGYSAELLLKAIIANRFQQGTFPDKKLVANLYIHNLVQLASTAGLSLHLGQDEKLDPVFGGYWQIVGQWTEESRYAAKSKLKAEELLQAIDDPDHGVARWLRLHF